MAGRRPVHHRRPRHGHDATLPAPYQPRRRIPERRRFPETRRSAPRIPARACRPARDVPRAPTRRSRCMTYFEGFVAPVPEANKDAYRKHANKFAPIAEEFGVRRTVEAWADDVPDGKVTDFKKAVDAQPGETVVFSFFEYPSKQERDAANEKFRTDPRMQDMGSNMPFDGKRIILGGFDAIVEEGSGGGDYVDGFVVPVPTDKREA